MPGSGRHYPTRPWRVWTFSTDRFSLSSTIAHWLVFPWAAVFSSLGAFIIFHNLRTVLAAFGIFPLPQPSASATMGIGGWILTAVVTLLFTGVLYFFGWLLMQSLSVTFDREHQLVTVRSGWMGLYRRRLPLSTFQQVCIVPGAYFLLMRMNGRDDNYDIVLTGANTQPVVIGFVTVSIELAEQVVHEVCDFTGLQPG